MGRVLALCAWLMTADLATAQDADDAYFGSRELKPTPEEANVLKALERSRPRGKASGKPVIGTDGSARFVFGSALPVIVCAPLQLTDIELQPGEVVQSLQIGDNSRWTVEPAIAGAAPYEVQHVIVRPVEVDIRTSLVVTTDRRTYRMQLVSDRRKYMSSVSFTYPEQIGAAFRRQAPQSEHRHWRDPRNSVMPRAGSKLESKDFAIEDVSFAYELEGDSPSWKPVRVFNDGVQTVIELGSVPAEAPALLVVRTEGGLFTDDEVEQTNFRTDGRKYIVDMVFDIADLVVGVGSRQQRVRIRRTR